MNEYFTIEKKILMISCNEGQVYYKYLLHELKIATLDLKDLWENYF